MLLAIETSTNVCSVSLRNKEDIVFEKKETGSGIHSERTFQFIEQLMNEHGFGIDDLDALLVSAGPGSYTGLRIAASAVKGLLFDKDVDLYAINTLVSFAAGVTRNNHTISKIHAVMDARRNHLFYQRFVVQNQKLEAETGIEIRELEKVQTVLNEDEAIVGTGLKRLESIPVPKHLVFDESIISADALFILYDHYRDTEWCRKVKVEDFSPDYYTSNQINNTAVKDS